jgi:hypothetical protein
MLLQGGRERRGDRRLRAGLMERFVARPLSGLGNAFLISAAARTLFPYGPERSAFSLKLHGAPALASSLLTTQDALRSGLRERHDFSGGETLPASGSGTPLRSASIQIRTPTVSPTEREARSRGETAARSAASGGSPRIPRACLGGSPATGPNHRTRPRYGENTTRTPKRTSKYGSDAKKSDLAHFRPALCLRPARPHAK